MLDLKNSFFWPWSAPFFRAQLELVNLLKTAQQSQKESGSCATPKENIKEFTVLSIWDTVKKSIWMKIFPLLFPDQGWNSRLWKSLVSEWKEVSKRLNVQNVALARVCSWNELKYNKGKRSLFHVSKKNIGCSNSIPKFLHWKFGQVNCDKFAFKYSNCK